MQQPQSVEMTDHVLGIILSLLSTKDLLSAMAY